MPGANVITGTTTAGFSGLPGGIWSADSAATDLEDASVTFMIVQTGTAPVLTDDIDTDDNGTPDGATFTGWTILDSIGALDGTATTDRAYGAINYSNNTATPGTAPGTPILVAFTAIYVGRNGDSTGSTGADWVATGALGGASPNWTVGANPEPITFANKPLNHIGSTNFDQVAPTVLSITRVNATPTNAGSVDFLVTFSESVTGVDTADFTLTTTGAIATASVTGVTGTGATRTVSVNTGTGDGTIRLDLTDNDTIVDGSANPLGGTGAGNGNFTTGEVYTIDKSVPTADITDVSPDPRSTSVSSISIVFSEAVSGFDLADLTLTRNGGGNLLTGSQTLTTGDNITWTLGNLSGITTADGNYVLTLTAAGAGITDAAGNALAVNATDSWSMDGAAPTVDITDVTPDPRNTSVSSIAIVFSEAVTGFDLADLSLTRDGGLNLLTGAQTLTSGDNITFTLGNLSGLTGTSGTYLLTLTAPGGITDGGGNPLAGGATDTWVVDATAPTVDIVDVTPDPRNTSVSTISIVFSEAITGFDLADLSLTRNGGLNLLTGAQTLTSGDNITWTLGNLSGLTGTDGTYVLTLTSGGIADNAGNGLAAGASDTWVFNGAAPTVDITDVTPDPRNTAVSSIAIVFSEAVTGFDLADLSLTRDGGGNLLTGAQTLTSGDNITFTLSNLSGLTGTSGTYLLTLTAPGGITDGGGAALASGATDTWVVDTTAPTVDIVDIAPDPRNTSVSTISIVFSEAITGFDLADLSLTRDGGGNLLTGAQTLTSGDNITWTLGNLSGLTGTDGTYVLTLTSGGIADNAGNGLAGGASDTWVFNAAAPTVDITDVTPDPRNTAVSSIAIVFSEPVTGFDLADLSLTRNGGANLLTGAQTLTSGDNITFTLGNLTGLTGASGTYLLTLTAPGGITDSGGAALASGATDSWLVDSTGPSVTINQAIGQADPTSTSPINFTVVFSEPTINFTTGDVTISGAGATTATVTEIAPNNGTTYNVAVSGMNANGNVVASVGAGVAIDALGNPNQASTSTDNTVTFNFANDAPTSEILIGLTATNALVTFNSNAPNVILSSRPITGLLAGELVIGIDFRPSNNLLYGYSNYNRLLTLNPADGAATAVGTLTAALAGNEYGIDFNPTADLLRLVNDTDQNASVDPNTGTTTLQSALNPGNPNVVGIAYSNNVPGAASTVLYDIDSNTDSLYIQNSPASGTLSLVGSLTTTTTNFVGFDISGASGVAYASLTAADNSSGLYFVNLSNGAATRVQTIGNGLTTIRDISVSPVAAPIVYAVTTGNQLISFNSARPGVILSSMPITGLAGGELILGIDFRPTTNELFGFTNYNRIVTINKTSGAATIVGTPNSLVASEYGFDFNPTVDHIRIVNNNDQNVRVSPTTGATLFTDGPLAYGSADPYFGQNPTVTGAAYTNSVAGATTTTLYDIDSGLDILATQNPANVGTLNTIGALGVDTNNLVGFDISGQSGVAYASLSNAVNVSSFYTINLLTGAATLIGSIGPTTTSVRDIAISTVPAPTIFGLTSGNNLVTFNSLSPGVISSSKPITNLQAGETVLAIDYRPATGLLFGYTGYNRVVTINTTTGAATVIGTAAGLAGSSYGFDFDPVADLLRAVNDNDQNVRINPATGSISNTDTNLAYAGGDPNNGQNPSIVGSGYTNSFAGALLTTLYGIDSNLDILVTQGSVNGSPTSPNSGQLFTVGSLGFNTSAVVGLDIAAANNAAYAALQPAGGGFSRLYVINLSTGQATLIGTIGGVEAMLDIAVAP